MSNRRINRAARGKAAREARRIRYSKPLPGLKATNSEQLKRLRKLREGDVNDDA